MLATAKLPQLITQREQGIVAEVTFIVQRALHAGGLAGATPPAEVQEAGLLGGVWGAAPTNTTTQT